MLARGLRPSALPPFFEPSRTAAAPSTMPEELPAWWTCLTASTSGWAWMATASKPPISPIITKEGSSEARLCMLVDGRMCSSVGKDGDAVDVPDRNDRLLEAAVFPALGCALLALHRIGIDIIAREAVFGGDQIGRYALRHEIGRNRDRRVHRPCAAGHAHADAAHRFDAAGDDDIVGAGQRSWPRQNSPHRGRRRRSG